MNRFVESLEKRQLFAAGDIDPTFGTAGAVAVTVEARQMLPQASGKVLYIGDTTLSRASATNFALDATFAAQGTVDLQGVFRNISDAIVLASGKILVSGRGLTSAALMRLTADGSADATFGTNGVVSIPNYVIDHIVEQSDGKIVFTGYSAGVGTVARTNADGSIDSSFTPFHFDVQGATNPPQLQSNGKIVIGGNFRKAVRGPNDQDKFFYLARLNTDGSLDTTFGDSSGYVLGKMSDSIGFLVLSDDRILEAGYRGRLAYLTRLTADGRLDGTFGTHGGTTPLNFGAQGFSNGKIMIAPSGQIIAAGFNAIARFSANGIPDADWGRVLTANYSIIPQSNGDLAVLSYGRNGTQVVRLQGASGGPAGRVSASGGVITATGTDLADNIDAWFNASSIGDSISVRIYQEGDVGRVFDADDITHINILAGGGNDRVTASGNAAIRISVSGGEGNDTLIGGPGEDSISGNAGNDFVGGMAGNDRLAGNGGLDEIHGNEGDDRIYGGSSSDTIAGGAGNDSIYGEGGNDHLYGGAGADFIHGNAGNDFLTSTDSTTIPPGGIDSLFGDGGRDRSYADPDDILTSIEVKSSGFID